MNEYDQSLAGVIRATVRDAQDLVRGEIALAKAELGQEAGRIGRGAAALAAGAVGGLLALTFLLAALALAISSAAEWPGWAGFAVVGMVVLAVAAALAMIGKSRLAGERHLPLTTDTLTENTQWLRARKS